MIVKTLKEHSYDELSPYEKMLVVMEDDPGDETPKRRMRVIKARSASDGRRTNYNDLVEKDDTPEEEPDTTTDDTPEEPPTEDGGDDATTGDENTSDEPVSDDTDYSDDSETSDDGSNEDDTTNGGEDNGEVVSDDTDYSDDTSNDENGGDSENPDDENQEQNADQTKSNDDKMNSIREKTHKHILYKKYMELYSTVNGYIESLDTRLSDDFTLNKKYKILGGKLKNIKNLLSDYMLVQFENATYIQSLLFYQRIIASIDMVLNLLLETNKAIINKKDK